MAEIICTQNLTKATKLALMLRSEEQQTRRLCSKQRERWTTSVLRAGREVAVSRVSKSTRARASKVQDVLALPSTLSWDLKRPKWKAVNSTHHPAPDPHAPQFIASIAVAMPAILYWDVNPFEGVVALNRNRSDLVGFLRARMENSYHNHRKIKGSAYERWP